MFKAPKILFGLILAFMIGVTTWASLDKNIVDGFLIVWREPWGAATLADAYCGFLTFYVWVFYKEAGWGARIFWFLAIMVFGNIAMSAYVLIKIAGLPAGAKIEDLLLRKPA